MATDQGRFVLLIFGEEVGPIPLEEYANFIRDLVFLHDRIWILVANDERLWKLYFSSWFYARRQKRVPDQNKLLLKSAEIGSPFKIEVEVNVGDWLEGAGKALVHVLQGIATLPEHIRQERLNTRLQEARVIDEEQRLARERNQPLRRQLGELPSIENVNGDARLKCVQTDIQRLSESHLRITRVEIIGRDRNDE